MSKFKQGQFVKAKGRTEHHELFLIVVFDPDPSDDQFQAVVICDRVNIYKLGDIANNWNCSGFELSKNPYELEEQTND